MLDKEIKKEILTRDKIKIDLKNLCSHNLVRSFGGFVVTVILCVVVLTMKFYSCLIFVIVGLLTSVLVLVKDLITLLQINKDNFGVLTDKLIGCQDEIFINMSLRLWLFKPYIFHFSSYGKYRIPEFLHYKWSEIYRMGYKNVYNRANIGDEFYLININKEIIIVYNSKHFDLKL